MATDGTNEPSYEITLTNADTGEVATFPLNPVVLPQTNAVQFRYRLRSTSGETIEFTTDAPLTDGAHFSRRA